MKANWEKAKSYGKRIAGHLESRMNKIKE